MFVRRKKCVFQSYQAPVPFICGVIRPKIILPEEQYTKKELEIILLHELEHYKQKDIFWKPKAVFWDDHFERCKKKRIPPVSGLFTLWKQQEAGTADTENRLYQEDEGSAVEKRINIFYAAFVLLEQQLFP